MGLPNEVRSYMILSTVAVVLTAAIAIIIWRLPVKRNLVSREFPKITPSDDEKLAESLDAVYVHICTQGEQAVNWYMEKKNAKRIGAWLLRGGAILTVAVAGLIPVLTKIPVLTNRVDALWSTVLLGTAGTLIAFDKFAGYTSSWVRYMLAGQDLAQALDAFRIDWESSRLSWASGKPTRDQASEMLLKAKGFLIQVHTIVREETKAWAVEFKSALQELEKAAQTATEAKRLGAINLRVTNGDQCAGEWTFALDSGPDRKSSGLTATINDVTADVHTIRAHGSIGGAKKRAEKAVLITAGAVTDVEMTLT